MKQALLLLLESNRKSNKIKEQIFFIPYFTSDAHFFAEVACNNFNILL
jgi:hypothetical protein